MDIHVKESAALFASLHFHKWGPRPRKEGFYGRIILLFDSALAAPFSYKNCLH